MKILAISAHADDVVICSSGTMIKHVKRGDEVYFCIVTKGYTPEWSKDELKEKREEALKAGKILGIKKIYFLDLPTVKLDTIPQKQLNDLISQYVNEVQPEIVYITHRGDINKDHRLVFEATMVATRPKPGCPVKKVLSYETLSVTEWAPPFPDCAFIPNVYVDVSDVLEEKMKIMSVYRTELLEYPHPRSLEMVEVLAKKRGAEIGVKAAEAFMLVREIVK